MADSTDRSPHNVPGPLYVDNSCIDCDMCRETAPAVFKRHASSGQTYVAQQPQSPEEWELAMEALNSCPTESIGADG